MDWHSIANRAVLSPVPGAKGAQRSCPTGFADRRHRALALLAGSPDGMTESFLLAHGFTTKLMAELVSDGLVTARAEWMRVRRREIEVTRVRITPAGERALYSLKRK